MSFLVSPATNPSSLNLWKWPIEFIPVPRSKRLLQPQERPVWSFFAVLQASILLNYKRFPRDQPGDLF
jgi:hypothetical protein